MQKFNEEGALVQSLVRELSSELDLHYEDDDLGNLSPTVEVIKEGVEYLKKVHQPIPQVALHIIRRFNRSWN